MQVPEVSEVTKELDQVKVTDTNKDADPAEDGKGHRPTLRPKKSVKKKKMTDDEIMEALSKFKFSDNI